MENNEMTKERISQIEKALAYCIAEDCTTCPFVNIDEDGETCKPLLFRLLADYIDFLKALKN